MDDQSSSDATSSSEKQTSFSPPVVLRKQNPSKKYSSCSVPTCKKNNRKHPGLRFPKFPSDVTRCRQWVKVVGDPDLVHVPVEKLCTLRRVCSEHFHENDFSTPQGPNGKARLSSVAVPYFFNPSVHPLSEEVMKDFVGYASQKPKKGPIQFDASPQALQVTDTSDIPVKTAPCPKKASKSVNNCQMFVPGNGYLSLKHSKTEQDGITPELFVSESSDDETECIIQMTAGESFSEMDSPECFTLVNADDETSCDVDSAVIIQPHPTEEAVLTQVSSPAETVTPYPVQVYPMRVQPGKEITTLLKTFVDVNCLKAAFILSCVGSVSSVDLRFATDKAGNHAVSKIRENLEICSLVGTVCSDGFHLHGTFGDSEGATLSGHVMGNMIVQTTAEIVLGHALGVEFNRVFDRATGFRELTIKSMNLV